MIELGLGLLSIGRPWGARGEPPPAEPAALALLERAIELGIRFFDTAPAYGESEAILGRFLRQSGARPFVATKMGEWWDGQASSVDHSYHALARSIDRSLERLGRIDLLQVHKATARNIASDDVARAIDYARRCGIGEFGASVADIAAVEAACRTAWCSWLQFPFNGANTSLAPAFQIARERNIKLVINRPLAMGQLSPSIGAFAFIRHMGFDGVILTGTKSIVHLTENHAAFHGS